MVKRFEIYWVDLDSTIGSEMKKTRPAVIISPNEMNQTLSTLIIAPLTSTIRNYPFRIHVTVTGKAGQVALDQLRAIDSSRIKSKIGLLSENEQMNTTDILVEMFR